jgi:hypothetical protein
LSWFLNNIDTQGVTHENPRKLKQKKKKTRRRLGSRCSEQEAKRCKKIKWYKNTLQQVVNTSYYSFIWNLSVELLAVLLLLLPRSRTSAESYPTEARSARAPSQKLMQQGESRLLQARQTDRQSLQRARVNTRRSPVGYWYLSVNSVSAYGARG